MKIDWMGKLLFLNNIEICAFRSGIINEICKYQARLLIVSNTLEMQKYYNYSFVNCLLCTLMIFLGKRLRKYIVFIVFCFVNKNKGIF